MREHCEAVSSIALALRRISAPKGSPNTVYTEEHQDRLAAGSCGTSKLEFKVRVLHPKKAILTGHS